jgi:hypothetical protein
LQKNQLRQDQGVFAAQIQGKFGVNVAELRSPLSPSACKAM